MAESIELIRNGGGKMSWAAKKTEIVGIAFLVTVTSMYGVIFSLNMNVVAGTEVSGHISTDTNWTVSEAPYWIVGDTYVDPGVTLHIYTGVSVLFNGTFYFNVSGNLVTHGDPTAFVSFSSHNYPDPGWQYWKGIFVKDNGSLVLEYTHVSNALCGITVESRDRGQGSVAIRGSEIVHNKDCGLRVGENSQVYITDSRIAYNDVGLDLAKSSGNVIETSEIVNNNYGIIGNYTNSYFQNSIISYNTRHGIMHEGPSGTVVTYSWYWGNIISENGQQTPPGLDGYGIYIKGGVYENVMCNMFYGNGVGLGLYSSTNVSVNQNDFISNQNHAVDDRSNHFDTGSIGNYWDDYNGTDPDGDGIGNTPYYIDSDSVDNYPLMHPLDGCKAPNQPPVANAGGPYFGEEGELIYFYGNSSIDVDGKIVDYEWNFGDGSPNGRGMVVSHIYSDSGIYDVTLTVTDDESASDTDTTYAEIIEGLPDPPGHIGAVLSGLMKEDVELSWELSGDDGAGDDDIVGYNIYRGTVYDAECGGYGLVATVPSGSTSWTDSLAGHGDTNTYFYCVGAEDDVGKESIAQQQASKYSKHLSTGMTLMSMPLIVSDNSITSIFETVSYVRVIRYDAKSGKKHNWKAFDTRKPYSVVFDIDHTMAVWVEVADDSYLTIAGLVPKQTVIHLGVGWNFVGFPSFLDYAVSDFVGVRYQNIETFDPTDPPWYLQRLDEGDFMTVGEGYWIHVSEDFDWVLTN